MSKQFIVLYDDSNGVSSTYGEDKSCEGALELTGGADACLWFENREDARNAIKISTLHNRLLQMQGKPYNGDFVECLKFIKIKQLKSYVKPSR